MIPAFKHPESMAAMSGLNGSNVVKKSKFPKEVVDDLFESIFRLWQKSHRFRWLPKKNLSKIILPSHLQPIKNPPESSPRQQQPPLRAVPEQQRS